MQQAVMAAYPWDLFDEGLDVALDRLQGEVGVSGLALHVAVPPVLEFRARAVEPRMLRTRGGLLFTQDETKYHATRCRAPFADWPHARHLLDRITDGCHRRGLTLRLIVSASRIGQLAARHPEFAFKNAFAAVSETSLCLLNPDVQAFLCALVDDLGSRPHISDLLIVDFTQRWSDADSSEFHWPGSTNKGFEQLAGLCFCESCHQRAAGAHVDSVVAQRMVRESIDAGILGAAHPADQRRRLAEAERINAYRTWQSAELTALFARMQKASPRRLARLVLADPTATSPPPPDIVQRVYFQADLSHAMRHPGQPIDVSLTPAFLRDTSAADLVSSLVAAAERGLIGVQFEHLGVSSDATLTAIKQAIRFARRANL